jgi:hypothetical protein
MRGAVFHRLGFNFVRERVLRRSYGMSLIRIPFNPKKDPLHLKTTHPSGIPACRVMKWYAVKVVSLVARVDSRMKGFQVDML